MDTEEIQAPVTQPQQEPQTPPETQIPVQSQQQMYAGFWIRWAALFIDIWVGIVPSALIAVILVLPIVLSSGEQLSKAFDSAPVSILFNGITALGVWFYFIFMTYKYGATLGKMALKLKVVSADEQSLTLQKVVIREVVGKFLSTLIFSIGYLIVAFSKKKQGLHDHLAGTYVIQTRPATGVVKFIIILTTFIPVLSVILLIAAIALLAIFFSAGTKGKSSVPIISNRLSLAHDAYRKSDIAQLVVALRAYNFTYKNYPSSFSDLVTSGDIKAVPTPPPNSDPQDQYGYETCLVGKEAQAIIYTKLANGNYWVYRTSTGRAVDSASNQIPTCP